MGEQEGYAGSGKEAKLAEIQKKIDELIEEREKLRAQENAVQKDK